MTLRSFVFPGFLLALACGDPTKSDEDPGDSSDDETAEDTSEDTSEDSAETGGDSGEESGGDSSGDSGGDTGGETGGDTGGETGPCPVYSGYGRQGRTWAWEYTDAYSRETGIVGGYDVVLDHLGASGDWSQTMAMAYSGGGVDSYDADYTSEGYCDADGAWLVASRVDYVMRVSGSTYSGWAETTYNPPMLSIPSGLSPGDSWTVRVAGTTNSSSGGGAPFDYSYTTTAGEPEGVTVPAGTFVALPMSYTIDGNRYTYWLDEEVGGVQSGTTELVDYAL